MYKEASMNPIGRGSRNCGLRHHEATNGNTLSCALEIVTMPRLLLLSSDRPRVKARAVRRPQRGPSPQPVRIPIYKAAPVLCPPFISPLF